LGLFAVFAGVLGDLAGNFFRSHATAPSLPGRAKWVAAISPTLGINETTLGPPLTWIRAGIPRKHDGKMLERPAGQDAPDRLYQPQTPNLPASVYPTRRPSLVNNRLLSRCLVAKCPAAGDQIENELGPYCLGAAAGTSPARTAPHSTKLAGLTLPVLEAIGAACSKFISCSWD
jgi:hypothetical protein